MVVTTQLRLAVETEEQRRAKKCLDLLLIEIEFFKISRNELARLAASEAKLIDRRELYFNIFESERAYI